MSFVSYGSLGSASAHAASKTIDLPVPSTVPVGHFVVIWIAWEQDYYSGVGPEGIIIPNLKASDTAGNHWDTLVSFMYESNTAMLIAQMSKGLTASDTITVEHRANFYVAKAISAWEFGVSNPDQFTWARMDRMAVAGAGNTTSGSIGYAPGRGGLYLHSLATEGPITDSWSWDAAWTQIDADGTNAAVPNISVRGGWKISDVTPQSVTATNTTAPRDNDVAMVVLCEVPLVQGFPRFPLIDDFNRADEDPVDGGIWRDGSTEDCFPTFGFRGMQVLSNQAAIGPGAGAGGAMTEEDDLQCYREVYATLAKVGNAEVGFDATGCGNHAFFDSRAIQYWPYNIGGGPGRSVAEHVTFGESGFTGGESGVGLHVWVKLNDGNKIGLQRDSRDLSVLHGYANFGSGWEWLGAMVQSAFPISAGAWWMSGWGDVVTRIDDFGGGGDDCPTYWVNMNWREAMRHKVASRVLLNKSDT